VYSLLQTMLKRFRIPAVQHGSGSEAAEGLPSPEQFRRVLALERMRCDRNGSHFSLLRLQPHGADDACIDQLCRVLSSRLRETDLVGWVDHGRLGVLLPETSRSGASTVAAAVWRRLAPGQVVDIEVYHYPTSLVARQPESSGRTRTGGGLREQGEPAVQPMEPLLSVPLPAWKRCVDIVLASTGLVVLAPALLLLGVAVKLTSPGPVLFRQLRTGFAGRPFVLYKFRTMCVDAEELKLQLLDRNEQDGPAFKIEEDPRVTPLGSFLRRSCIDELPQFWNVLKGEMTLVGPRPLPCEETAQCRAWEHRRLDVTPGLTCFWQVGGSRLDFAEWMRLDLRYIRERSPAVDARLLWKTFVKVLLQRASC